MGRRRASDAEITLSPPVVAVAKGALTRMRSLAWSIRRAERSPAGTLRILLYHRVSRDRDPLAVWPDRFRDQMDLLADEGFQVLDLVSAVTRLRRGDLSPRTIALTFDDGYQDVADEAVPILRARGFRATVFVASGLTDGRIPMSWYDGTPPPLLGWSEVVELDREGTLQFEAHSVTHRNLPALDEPTARGEIADSKTELQNRLGRSVDAFCYPAGLFGERERRLVAEAGFTLAVCGDPGLNTATTNPYALRRIQVERRDRRIDFRAKIAGAHDSPLPFRTSFRRLRYGPSS